MRPMTRTWLVSALAAWTVGAVAEPPADLPPDFKQLIPRGTIASIDAPEFVLASEAGSQEADRALSDLDPPD